MVVDSSGAAVPGAEVLTANVNTNATQHAITDPEGQYPLLALQPGIYKMTVTAPGFTTFTTTGIDVKVNDQLHIDATLIETNTGDAENDDAGLTFYPALDILYRRAK